MKIFLASDHAGFELKEKVKEYLLTLGNEVEDCGATVMDPNDDYPIFVSGAAKNVAQIPGSFGIVFGKSGTGEAIVANKIKGIRAALAVNDQNVKLSREHNDANILSFGSSFVTPEQAKTLSKLFLETSFSNEERHKRRIEQIEKIEND